MDEKVLIEFLCEQLERDISLLHHVAKIKKRKGYTTARLSLVVALQNIRAIQLSGAPKKERARSSRAR